MKCDQCGKETPEVILVHKAKLQLAIERLKQAQGALLAYIKGGARDQRQISQLEQGLAEVWQQFEAAISTQ